MTNPNRLFCTIAAAFGGFLMGFEASVIAGPIALVSNQLNLSDLETGWIVSVLTLSAAFSMLVAGFLCQNFGRKPVMQTSAILFLIASLVSANADSVLILMCGRALGGLAVGAILVAGPMYIAEIAPANKRGFWVSLNQLNIVLGISTAFFSNYLIVDYAAGQSFMALAGFKIHIWRLMFVAEAIPALVLICLLFFIEESPLWAKTQKGGSLGFRPAISMLLAPTLRRVFCVAVILAVTQQITGINAVLFYGPTIFKQAGFTENAAFAQAIVLGLANCVFTIIAMLAIDRIGRRPLLFIGLMGLIACLASMGLAFHFAQYQLSQEDVLAMSDSFPSLSKLDDLVILNGQSFENKAVFLEAVETILGIDVSDQLQETLLVSSIKLNGNWVLISLVGVVAFFAVSVGPVTWLVFSELFPSKNRAFAVAILGLINSATSFMVQLTFPYQLAQLGVSQTFFIYAVATSLCGLLLFKYLPESKGRLLD